MPVGRRLFLTLNSSHFIIRISLLILLASCQGEDNESESKTSLIGLYEQVIKEECALGCHEGTSKPEGGPDFSQGANEFYQAVVNVPASTYEWTDDLDQGCLDVSLVKPGEPNASLLAGTVIQSVFEAFAVSDCTPGFSNHTAGNNSLTGNQANSLIDWIKKGANLQ